MDTRNCLNCGISFEYKRADHFFCSGKCVAAFYRTHPNPEMIHTDLPHDIPHTCEWCGVAYNINEYAERGGQRAPKYCSPKCKQAAYRARGKATQEQAERRHQSTQEQEARQRADEEWRQRQEEARRQSDNRQQREQQQRRQNPPRPGRGHMTRDTALRILNLSSNFDSKELKRAWYRELKKYHPDVNKSPDATQRTQEVNAAYEYLKR